MREVEFRGKDIKTKEWHYGSLVSKYDADACDYCEYHILEKFEYSRTVDYDSNLYNVDFYEVDENTLGQCTGLKDKNGTKIFEGDIVKGNFPYAEICVVVWSDKRCGFYLQPISKLGRASYDPYYKLNSAKLEIIGNIFRKRCCWKSYFTRMGRFEK